MDKKIINWFFIVTVLVLLLIPVIINYLMFINILPVSGEESTWIGALSTFWGAILGGVISGALTLYGVRYTLIRQENKDIINSYSEKRKLGDDILLIVLECYRVVKQNAERHQYIFIASYLQKIINNRDEILSKASKVSDDVYEEIRSNFLVDIRELDILSGQGKLAEGKEERYKYYISRLDKQTDNISKFLNELTTEYRKAKNIDAPPTISDNLEHREDR